MMGFILAIACFRRASLRSMDRPQRIQPRTLPHASRIPAASPATMGTTGRAVAFPGAD
jgi:hypothetical protein